MPEEPLKIVTPNNVAGQGGIVFWDGGKAIAQTPIVGGNAAIVRVGGVDYAYGEHGSELRSSKVRSLFRAAPQPIPAVPVPARAGTPYLVHLFVISDQFLDLNFSSSENTSYATQHYWISDGTNALKIFETNRYTPSNPAHDESVNELVPLGIVLGGYQFWVLNENRFIFQFSLLDYTVFDRFHGNNSDLIRFQTKTILVEDWAIAFQDTQTSSSPNAALTYPSQLSPYSAWLAQTERSSILSENIKDAPIIASVDAANPSFGVDEYVNIDENGNPFKIEYVFNSDDLLGGSGSYDGIDAGDLIKFDYGPLELLTFERQWNVVGLDSEEETATIPAIPFSQFSSSTATFTDGLPLYWGNNQQYTIGQIKSGAFDPEGKIGGIFQTPEPDSSGIANDMVLLRTKGIIY